MVQEIYEQLKTIDYMLICFLNKYRIIHKYTKLINDIFLNTINEYNTIINNVQQKYKLLIYNSLNKNYLEFKEHNEIQEQQNKKISKIKENLKHASKLTNTDVDLQETEEKKYVDLNRELKINCPYSVMDLYKLRYYRNLFIKNYSTLTKNDNYLNACMQRRRFFEKLKLSAVTQNNKNEKLKGTDVIYTDEDKNMIRILNENHFFKESQVLKEMLLISKYLNKAKNIINNIPEFIYTIIEEFEITESQFNENMYLFILLALNKWIKKIILECEQFVTYKKNRVNVKGEAENVIYKKHNDYMNDILQRGIEHTMNSFNEKSWFSFPCSLYANVNTSFLTYYFLYLNKNLLGFLEGYYTGRNDKERKREKSNLKKKDPKKTKEGIKRIMLYKKEESLYMKNDIYNYKLQNEFEEINIFRNIGFEIDGDLIYPNIFLICNYLLQEETKKIIKEIYKLQRNGFHLMFYEDISIVIQIVINLTKKIKVILKSDLKKKQKKNQTKLETEKEQEEEGEEDEDEETDTALEKLQKYISKANINYKEPTDYKKLLGPLRLMILNLLKLIHVLIKSNTKNSICTFWQTMSICDEFKSYQVEQEEKENQQKQQQIDIAAEGDAQIGTQITEPNDKNNVYNLLRNYEKSTFVHIKKDCNENNCYLLIEKKEPQHNELHYTHIVKLEQIINKRTLCYDFYKIVAGHIEQTKLEIENKKNRDVYTGILKKKKYKLEGSKTKKTIGRLTAGEEKRMQMLPPKKPVTTPVTTKKPSKIVFSKKELSRDPPKESMKKTVTTKMSSAVDKLKFEKCEKSEKSKIIKTQKSTIPYNITEGQEDTIHSKGKTKVREANALIKERSKAVSSVKIGTEKNKMEENRKSGSKFLNKASSSGVFTKKRVEPSMK